MLMLAVVAIATSAPAVGDWLRLSETDQGVRYVDRATSRRRGRYARIWTKYVLSGPGADDVQVTRERVKFDCVGQMVLLAGFVVGTDSEGQPHFPEHKIWNYVPVGKSGDFRTMMKIACRHQG